MAQSQFPMTMSMVAAVAACCLLSVPEACGQFQRNNQQRGFGNQQQGGQRGGGQNSGVFLDGQQGRTFGGGQQGSTRGLQFGQSQQSGIGTTSPGQGAFVGSDAQDMRRAFENMSGRQHRQVMFDMVVENLNEMRDRRRQREGRRRRPNSIRVQLRPSFNYPRLESRQVAVALQSSLARSSDLTGLVAPRVELVGRTATVSGFVPSEHERAVIEKMIALQPGVSNVENLLTVDPAAASAGPSSVEGSEETSLSADQAAESSAE